MGEVASNRYEALQERWRPAFFSSLEAIASEAQLHQALLAEVLSALGAGEAYLVGAEGEAFQVLASRDRAGSRAAGRPDPTLLARARAERRGIARASDAPPMLAAPVIVGDQVAHVFCLARPHVPFDAEDMRILESFSALASALFARRANRQPVGGLAYRNAQAADALRTTMRDLAVAGATGKARLDALLESSVRELRLEAIAIVVTHAGRRWVIDHPGAAWLRINWEFVETVAAIGRSLCAIDVPAGLDEVTTGMMELSSVAVAPLGGANTPPGVVYCVRRNLASPLTEADLPRLEACAEILAEALAGTDEGTLSALGARRLEEET